MSRLFDALKKLEDNKEKGSIIANNLAIFKKQKQINLKIYLSFFFIILMGILLVFNAKVFLNKKHQKKMDLRRESSNILKSNVSQENLNDKIKIDNKDTKNNHLTQKESKRMISGLNSGHISASETKKRKNLEDFKETDKKFKEAFKNKKKKIYHPKVTVNEKNNYKLTRKELRRKDKIDYSDLIIAEEERKKGNFKRAIKFYEKYLTKNKEVDHKTLNNLGALYLKTGNLEKAIIYLKKAYVKNSKDPKITKNLFIAYWKMGDREKACEIIKDKNLLFEDWYQKFCH